MLRIVERPARELLVPCSGARDVLVSWNATSPHGALELEVTCSDGERSGWLPYAEWSASERRSLNGGAACSWIEYDAVRAPRGAAYVVIRSSVDLDALAVAPPPPALAMVLAFHGYELDIPTVAAGVFDSGYGGAGNWAFNVAFAGRLGLRAADAYL